MRRFILLTAVLAGFAAFGGYAHVATAAASCPYQNTTCFGGYTLPQDQGPIQASRRGVRAKITRQPNLGWSVNSAFAASWIGIQQLNSNGSAASDFLQAGIIKGVFSSAAGCSGDTQGSVKVFWYRIDSGGNPVSCGFGQIVSSGEGHAFNIQRCNGSDWCFYLDGTLLHEWSGGLPSTMNTANALSECNGGASGSSIPCHDSRYVSMFTNFGGTGSSASPNFSVADDGHDCGCANWYNATSSNTVTSNDDNVFDLGVLTTGQSWSVVGVF